MEVSTVEEVDCFLSSRRLKSVPSKLLPLPPLLRFGLTMTSYPGMEYV